MIDTSMHKSPENEYFKEEIIYGPDLSNEKQSRIENYYSCLEFWTVALIFLLIPILFIYIFIVFSSLRPLLIVYLLWMYYDRNAADLGRKRLLWTRKLKGWHYIRDYFPIKMVKTAELPPDTTYLMASFPHGLFSPVGITINFLSDVNHFSEAYPGINPYIMVLRSNFKWPVSREIGLAFGCRAASEKGILNVLEGPSGNACVLIVGGMAEASLNDSETYNIVLKNRKGFVRLALKAGSSLVPVFSFGETHTYKQLSNNHYKWLKTKLKNAFGIRFYAGKGRGFLHCFAYKIPITTIIGKPIKLPKVENPSQELIDKYHQIFIEEITHLFHKYKHKYDISGEKATLSIV